MVSEQEYEELQRENRKLKNDIVFVRQQERRKANMFRMKVEAINAVRSKILDSNDKVVLIALVDYIAFKAHDKDEGDYRLVHLGEIKKSLGGLNRINSKLDRFVLMGLIQRLATASYDVFYLRIPNNFLEIIENLGIEHESRNWHATRYCPHCEKDVPVRIRQRIHQTIECPVCNNKIGEDVYKEDTYFMGEKDESIQLEKDEFQEKEGLTEDDSREKIAARMVETLAHDGFRFAFSNVDDSLLLGVWPYRKVSNEYWMIVRNLVRPFDSEIVALIKRGVLPNEQIDKT